jgi:predicted aldo/keto reductase-like oxidoreductase
LPCPHGVDIPIAFSFYNDKKIFGGVVPSVFYLMKTTENKSYASSCTKCGICEKKCPQHIPIMKELDNVNSTLEKWYYKFIYKLRALFT